jgi:predicted outer membrane protein
MKRHFLITLCTWFALGLSAFGLSKSETSFVTEAAGGNLAEIKLGELAAQKGTDPKVKDFGSQMVNDHAKANNDLKPIANAGGVQWRIALCKMLKLLTINYLSSREASLIASS